MYAMQYTVHLPADYDMDIIRERVERTGRLMDGFAGLRFKAYAMREKARGATGNEYAPFYVWNDADGMAAFCWGEPGYSAIVRDFGRRPIEDWTVAGFEEGPARIADARRLALTRRALPAGLAPSLAVGRAIDDFLAGTTPHTVWRVAAVDVTTWTVVLVELSSAGPTDQSGDHETAVYEVLHVSTGA